MAFVIAPIPIGTESWSADWAWGLPLIALNVIFHVLGLAAVRGHANRASTYSFCERHPGVGFALVVGIAALLCTVLHAVEASIWAAAYRLLNALPDAKSAMLYSINAVTSYGHVSLELEYRWQLMGALEALNGWLLFGLSTAFLFATMEKIWSMDKVETHARTMSAGT